MSGTTAVAALPPAAAAALLSSNLALMRAYTLGIALSATLYGCTMMQVSIYYAVFGKKDRTIFKVLVCGLTFFTTGFLTFNTASLLVAQDSIMRTGFPDATFGITALTSFGFLTLIVLFTGAYFQLRAHGVNPNRITTAIGVILIVTETMLNVGSMGFQFCATTRPNLAVQAKALGKSVAWMNFLVELYIFSVLMWGLRNAGKLAVRPTYDPLMEILRQGISTSGLFLPLGLIYLILVMVDKHAIAPYGQLVSAVFGQLAPFCCIAALNQRAEIRARVSSDERASVNGREDISQRASRLGLSSKNLQALEVRLSDGRRSSTLPISVEVEEMVKWDDERITMAKAKDEEDGDALEETLTR